MHMHQPPRCTRQADLLESGLGGGPGLGHNRVQSSKEQRRGGVDSESLLGLMEIEDSQ